MYTSRLTQKIAPCLLRRLPPPPPADPGHGHVQCLPPPPQSPLRPLDAASHLPAAPTMLLRPCPSQPLVPSQMPKPEANFLPRSMATFGAARVPVSLPLNCEELILQGEAGVQERRPLQKRRPGTRGLERGQRAQGWGWGGRVTNGASGEGGGLRDTARL